MVLLIVLLLAHHTSRQPGGGSSSPPLLAEGPGALSGLCRVEGCGSLAFELRCQRLQEEEHDNTTNTAENNRTKQRKNLETKGAGFHVLEMNFRAPDRMVNCSRLAA